MNDKPGSYRSLGMIGRLGAPLLKREAASCLFAARANGSILARKRRRVRYIYYYYSSMPD
jgi:hypothetical protein